jgi:hypothetical protein
VLDDRVHGKRYAGRGDKGCGNGRVKMKKEPAGWRGKYLGLFSPMIMITRPTPDITNDIVEFYAVMYRQQGCMQP